MLDKISYAINEIRQNGGDSWWWKNRIRHRGIQPVVNARYKSDNPCYVMEEDWDNLIVLDACRLDLFEEVFKLNSHPKYETKTSAGSCTPEWVDENFVGEEFGDTVYVSANPHLSLRSPDSFYKLVELWKNDFDEEKGTVLPQDVREAALEHFEGDKRLVAHFIQPHHPFLVEDDFWDLNDGSWVVEDLQETDERPYDPWEAYDMGLVEYSELWQAYRTTLLKGAAEATNLADELPGRTVITSDHGNLLGEYWMYGHPYNFHVPELVEMPWLVYDDGTGERRETVDDGVSSVSDSESESGDEIVADRLSDLGYV